MLNYLGQPSQTKLDEYLRPFKAYLTALDNYLRFFKQLSQTILDYYLTQQFLTVLDHL